MVACLLATPALWVRIQTYLKDTKWAKIAKEWPTHSSPPKNIQEKKKEKKKQRDQRGWIFFLTVHFQFMCPLSIYVSPSPNNLPWAGSRAGPPVSEYVSPVRKNYLEVCTRTKLRCLHSWEWDYTLSHMRIITHFFGT